ncbi:MAG: ATP-binding protein [Methanobrevibacter sp.]|nr:ATP-binding protein [Candidatus Methanovirga australis]
MQEDIMNSLSLGLSEFDDIIKQSKIYVDKTRFIKKMMDQGRKYYFLSRPRRFGKTLLVSTLENFFNGKKELFKDTYIYDNWEDWIKYPIIRISMKQVSNENPKVLKEDLSVLVRNIAEDNNIKLSEDGSYAVKFGNLIKELSKNNKSNAVVLIDEYDAPILSNLDDMTLANKNRKVLQEFYNVLKESEKYLKFVFITGLNKFTKVSIFSTFNNLTELTLDKDYSTICGITHEELKKYYKNHIQILADENNYSFDEALERIDYFYDGYSWDGINNVFNPNSTLRALAQKEFQSFWFSTGTPNFIAEIFKKRKITEDYFKPIILKATELDAIDPDNINETTLLFQAGYLTIKEKIFKDNILEFSLRIPNFEVEQAFKDNLLNLYIEKFENRFRNSQRIIWDELINGDCRRLSEYLRAFIAGIPYYNRVSMDNGEKWKVYSMIFTIWAEEAGFYLTVERAIEDGRIDFIIESINQDQTIIVEMKYTADQSKTLDSLINEAFKQINSKKYWWAYTGDIKLMALALKDIEVDKGFITDVKCQIKDV